VYYSTLQNIATHCNTLQHIATHCNTPQHIAPHCNTLQHTATHCNTLQLTATHCNTLQDTTAYCNTLQHTARNCNIMQHTAPDCNTLQHTTTHCNTLQHTATHSLSPKSSTKTSYFIKSCDNAGRLPKKAIPQGTHWKHTRQTHFVCHFVSFFPNHRFIFWFHGVYFFLGGQHAERGCNVLQCVRSTPCHKTYVQHTALRTLFVALCRVASSLLCRRIIFLCVAVCCSVLRCIAVGWCALQ